MRSGKDFTAQVLMETISGAALHMKMSDPVKAGCHRLHGLDIDINEYEQKKDLPLDEFNGLTARNAYIHYWGIMSKNYGKDVLGRIALENIKTLKAPTTIILDAGRQEEADVLFGHKILYNSSVLQVQNILQTSYPNDIRHAIRHPDPRNIHKIINKNDYLDLKDQVVQLTRSHKIGMAAKAVNSLQTRKLYSLVAGRS